jgi:flagellar M-ring protein FliF
LVDGNYENVTAEDGTQTLQYKPRDTEELNRLTALVKNAVGFDETRKDLIEVVSMQFDTQALEDNQTRLDEIATRSFYMDVGKKVLMVVAGLLLFLYARRKFKKMASAVARYVPPLPPPPSPPQPPEPQTVAQPQKARLVDQMKRTAEDRPDEIARVIRTIMTE